MARTKKLLSFILSIAMILTTLGALSPTAFAATVYDGSQKLDFANATDAVTLEYGLAGIGGKDASDLIYKFSRPETDSASDSQFISPYIYETRDKTKKGKISFDVMFTGENAGLNFAAGTWRDETYSNSNFENCGTIVKIGTYGIRRGYSSESICENAPTALSANEWHNVAVVLENNGTKDVSIYIDGTKYTALLNVASYGIRHMRVGLSAGTCYIDNYVCDTADYDPTPYVMDEITANDTDKIAYDAETKTFNVTDSTVTALDIKNAITTNDTVKVFANALCSAELADTDTVNSASRIVVLNGSGAYRYYNINLDVVNDTDFDYVINSDGTATITGFKEDKVPENGAKAEITIPQTIAGFSVTAIGNSAFEEGTDINKIGKVNLPSTVKTIGDKAFYDCYGLTAVNFSEAASLETIGNNAFTHSNLETVETPASLKTIGDRAFAYVASMSVLKLNDGLESIGTDAFVWCANITEVIFPDSVTTIKNAAFEIAYAIKKLRFPRNESYSAITNNLLITSGAERAFGDMEIYIPETITTIPDDLLKYFGNGKTVTIYATEESAAHDFYNTYKDSGYTSNYGTVNVKFIEYDFDNNIANVINETGVNTGDKAIYIANPQLAYPYNEDKTKYFFTTTATGNTAGNYGKAADDVTVKINTKGAHAGYGFFEGQGVGYTDDQVVTEFSIMIPKAATIGMQFGYFYKKDENGNVMTGSADYKSLDILKISESKIKVNGAEVMGAEAGKWYTIAVVSPKAGEKEGKVYINGTAYDYTLAENYLKVRHQRIYSEWGTVIGTKTDVIDGQEYTYTDRETFDYYIDNFRSAAMSKTNYNQKWDAAASVSATDSEVRIADGAISYDNQKTVSELKEKLSVKPADTNIRVYKDRTCTQELGDDETVPAEAILVAAAKNGFSFERTYSYYVVNDPHVNTTIFNYSLNAAGEAVVTGFKTENIVPTDDLTAINIPETIAGYTVTEIGAGAFKSENLESINHQIQSVVLPNTIKKIGQSAFAGAKWSDDASNLAGSIKNVKLNEGLEEIGSYAFSTQSGLSEISLPESLKKIGNDAFYWTSVNEISIPDSVTSIGSAAFSLCSNLTYVKLPSGITKIPSAIFRNSRSIKTFVIPQSITGFDGVSPFTYDIKTEDSFRPSSAMVYGAAGSYAQDFATKYGYEFVALTANIIVAEPTIWGNGVKELSGTSYDIDYGFKFATYSAKLTNVGTEDINAKVILALYDKNGKMLTADEKTVSVEAAKSVSLSGDNAPKITFDKIEDGYTVKAFVWRSENNEPIANAKEINFDKDNQEIHVLTIANSFCNDSFGFMQDIAKAGGVIIKTQNMYSGGASLKQHYTNLKNNGLYSNTVVNMKYLTPKPVWEEIASDKWNVVALQPATHGYSTDKDFLVYDNDDTKKMYNFIKDKVIELAPNAKRVMHMSWGPDDSQSRVMLKSVFGLDVTGGYPAGRQTLYEKQKEAFKFGAGIFSSDGTSMVPTSVAVQYAIEHFGFAEHGVRNGTVTPTGSEPRYTSETEDGTPALYRDATCHMTSDSPSYGRVLVALTWYEFLTGKDVRENPYQNSGISAENMAKLKEAAHFANQNPDWTFGK